jgi:hypothetical protein
MRCNHFNTTLVKELIVKIIAIVCFIPNQLVRCIFGKAAVVYGVVDKLYLVKRIAFHVSGGRKTRSVRDCRDLGTIFLPMTCSIILNPL